MFSMLLRIVFVILTQASARTWTMSTSGLELRTQKSWSLHPETQVPDSKCLPRLVSLQHFFSFTFSIIRVIDRQMAKISVFRHTVLSAFKLNINNNYKITNNNLEIRMFYMYSIIVYF